MSFQKSRKKYQIQDTAMLYFNPYTKKWYSLQACNEAKTEEEIATNIRTRFLQNKFENGKELTKVYYKEKAVWIEFIDLDYPRELVEKEEWCYEGGPLSDLQTDWIYKRKYGCAIKEGMVNDGWCSTWQTYVDDGDAKLFSPKKYTML